MGSAKWLGLIVAIILVGIAYLFLQTPTQSDEEYEVARVIDGDTIELSSGDKVRLIGINTPETNQPYYSEASWKLKELIGDSKVTLSRDVEDRDQYGRLLRYVHVNRTFVNLEMVRQGMATAYEFEPNTKHASEFEAVESEARSAKVGLWTPSQYTLTISHFSYDAPGNDNENLNEETVTMKNFASLSLNMTGWILTDESNNEYRFSSFALAGNASFTLHTGKGTDTHTDLFWGCEESIWTNNGDSLFLRDKEGFLVVYYSY